MEDRPTESITFSLDPEGSAEPNPCLIVLKGPEKGACLLLRPGFSVIGRSREHADLIVQGRGVSRAHARIHVREGGPIEVVDLGSTNGTFVHGEKLIGSAILVAGDNLTLGPEVVLQLGYSHSNLHQVLNDLYHGAHHDGLTGVLNRRSLLARMAEEFSSARRHGYPCTVAVLDLDHFKQVNDRYGHLVGDEVLRSLAQILRHSVRAEDLVGRYGGEEFVLHLRYAPRDGALSVLQRIRSEMEQVRWECAPDLRVTVSIGVCEVPPQGAMDAAIACADSALYRAKGEGRNRIVSADLTAC